MEENRVTSSLQDRVDKFALAYVKNHYDIKSMSVTEFIKACDEAGKEILHLLAGKN